MNVKHISELENGLIEQVVFERRGLIIQGPLYVYSTVTHWTSCDYFSFATIILCCLVLKYVRI